MKIHFIENENDLIGVSHSDNALFLCKSCYTYTVKCMRSMIAKPFLCRSCICRENILNPDTIKKKENTTFKRYGSKKFTNRELAYKTCKENTGYENPWQNPEHHKNLDKVFIEKFGYKRPFLNDKIKQKARENRDYELIRKSVKETCGVEFAFLTEKAQENRRKKLIDTYGTDKIMHIPGIASKTHKKFYKDEMWFDSKPEYEIYKFLIENDIDFEYQPDVSFVYNFNGSHYNYYPDFLIEDEYYEYKGLHFFKNHNPNDRMICPFKSKDETEEEHKNKCDLYEAKHQCMIHNGVHIITDVNEIFNKFKQI